MANTASLKQLSFLDRFLTRWIFLAMAIAVLIMTLSISRRWKLDRH